MKPQAQATKLNDSAALPFDGNAVLHIFHLSHVVRSPVNGGPSRKNAARCLQCSLADHDSLSLMLRFHLLNKVSQQPRHAGKSMTGCVFRKKEPSWWIPQLQVAIK